MNKATVPRSLGPAFIKKHLSAAIIPALAPFPSIITDRSTCVSVCVCVCVCVCVWEMCSEKFMKASGKPETPRRGTSCVEGKQNRGNGSVWHILSALPFTFFGGMNKLLRYLWRFHSTRNTWCAPRTVGWLGGGRFEISLTQRDNGAYSSRSVHQNSKHWRAATCSINRYVLLGIALLFSLFVRFCATSWGELRNVDVRSRKANFQVRLATAYVTFFPRKDWCRKEGKWWNLKYHHRRSASPCALCAACPLACRIRPAP